MFIKQINIENFKSFSNLDIELRQFNVLIGANAAGKTNFIQLFKFLKDIVNHGLDNAVSLQGGVEYLRNINVAQKTDLSVSITYDRLEALAIPKHDELIGMKTYETTYQFILKFVSKGLGFNVSEDRFIHKCRFFKLENRKSDHHLVEKEILGEGVVIISNVNGVVDISFRLPNTVQITENDIIPPFIREQKLPPNALLLEKHFYIMPPWDNIFGNTAIYDFDPKLPKKAVPITGKAELEEDGNNLALVLKNLISDKENKRLLSNLLKELLPFVADLNVEKFSDKSLLFTLREVFSKKQYVPASFISDGTISIIALIIALYFERKSVVVIEEPERNIHPYLISKVVGIMKDASKNKQIILTTQSPDVVKYTDLEDIMLVTRNNEGFSAICRPGEKSEVKTFLENEIGIDELYEKNLLEL